MCCSLCDEINNKEDNLFLSLVGNKYGLENRILYEDENWLIIPTLGCFKIGYILIVSKLHYQAIASLPTEMCKSLDNLLNRVSNYFQKYFSSNCIAFEHGAVDEKYKTSCCIDHMHLHVLPFNKHIWNDIVPKYKIKFYQVDSFSQLKDYIQINSISSYLFFRDINDSCYIIDANKNIFPSQFFRQVLSKEIDSSLMWDWRHYIYEDNIIDSLKIMKGNFI